MKSLKIKSSSLLLLCAITFLALFFHGCPNNSAGGSNCPPAPPPPPAAKKFLYPLDLSFSIDPLAGAASMQASPGTDASITGKITASLGEYKIIETGYLFYEDAVFFIVNLEGTDIPDDLLSVKIQVSDLGSDSVVPVTVLPEIPGLEELAGQNPVSGYDAQGLPYYSYGDFYSSSRALVYGPAYSNWVWLLAFDLNDCFQNIEIKAEVVTQVPQPDDSQANLTISPFMSGITANSVAIIWETDRESSSVVHYGRDQSIPLTAQGSVSRYQNDEFSPGLAPFFKLFRHQAILIGLEPDTTYYYQVRAAKEPSPVIRFQTLADQAKPGFKFGVYGDTQKHDEAHSSVVNQMTNFRYDFLVKLGDFTDGFAQWSLRRNFFKIEKPLLDLFPIFPVHGNHDDFVWYKEYFEIPPNSAGGELYKHCYSFFYQGVYFVIVDTDYPLDPGSAQYNWLKKELETAYLDPDRKFTFIFSHQPFFSGYYHFAGLTSLAAMAPLFQAYDVSAGFAGHVHLYERLEVSGKPFIISGAAGSSFYEAGIPPDPVLIAQEAAVSGDAIEDKYHDWVYEFLIVEVGPDYFEISAYNKDGEIFDSVNYRK